MEIEYFFCKVGSAIPMFQMFQEWNFVLIYFPGQNPFNDSKISEYFMVDKVLLKLVLNSQYNYFGSHTGKKELKARYSSISQKKLLMVLGLVIPLHRFAGSWQCFCRLYFYVDY